MTQKHKILATIIRVSFCWILIWKLRSSAELLSVTEELDALLPKKTLEKMYHLATAEKHSFWYINLLNDDPDSTWYKNFDQKIMVIDK